MNYYAVERSSDHLAHYGVKGMKWGVRKSIALQNEKMLDRSFKKAAKKLAKLHDKAYRSGKYAAKAAGYGAAAAGVGTLVVGGTKLTAAGLKAIGKATEGTGRSMLDSRRHGKLGTILRKSGSAISKAGKDLDKWGESGKRSIRLPGKHGVYITNAKTGKLKKLGDQPNRLDVNNNTLFRLGAGVVTAGLGAAAARNAYIAANSRKYANKANSFRTAMDDAFSGTKYQGQYVVPPKVRKKKRR